MGTPLIASALLLTVAGQAAAQPTTPQLDVGSYATVPSPPLGLAGTTAAGARVEAQQMASFVVGPWDVDPDLTDMFDDGAAVIDGAESLRLALPQELADVGVRHNIVYGFSGARRSADKYLDNTVLRFADAPAASAAAVEFADVAADRLVPGGPVQPAEVPGRPGTTAFSNDVEDDGQPMTYARAFTAHGPYVLYQLAGAGSGVTDTVALIAGTLDRQVPLIDQFPLTPPVLLASKPVDPTGLLARSVPMAPGDITPEQPGVYDGRAALHFEAQPFAAASLFTDAGMTYWAQSEAGVYQTPDPVAAQRLADAFMRVGAQFDSSAAAPVPGLPGSWCTTLRFPEDGEVANYCVMVADRYVVESEEPTLVEAHQKVAAQYTMLMHR